MIRGHNNLFAVFESDFISGGFAHNYSALYREIPREVNRGNLRVGAIKSVSVTCNHVKNVGWNVSCPFKS